MCVIAGKDNLEKLSDLELAMIIYAALLHDIGMWISSDEIAKIENSSQFEFYLKKIVGISHWHCKIIYDLFMVNVLINI